MSTALWQPEHVFLRMGLTLASKLAVLTAGVVGLGRDASAAKIQPACIRNIPARVDVRRVRYPNLGSFGLLGVLISIYRFRNLVFDREAEVPESAVGSSNKD